MDRRRGTWRESSKKGVMNFSDIDNVHYTAEEILPDKYTDIEEKVTNKELMKTVLGAIDTLDEGEKWLVQELFFCGKSERTVAAELMISKTALHYRKEKIIVKIRKQILGTD